MRATSTAALTLVLVVAGLAGGCDRAAADTPVGPSTQGPVVDVSGSWTGTRSVEWDATDGNGDDGGRCTWRVVATFSQEAALVRGRLIDVDSATCSQRDEVDLEGVVRGQTIWISFPDAPRQSAVGRLDGDTLIVNWSAVRWTLVRRGGS